jgi:hypothetical protein
MSLDAMEKRKEFHPYVETEEKRPFENLDFC